MAQWLPKWCSMYQLDDNPKWPDISSKITRALLMRQKGRMLPAVLSIEVILAIVMFSGTNAPELAWGVLPSMSPIRLLGGTLCVAGSLLLFWVSVFLEPPPSEEGRKAIRASLAGPLMCLKTNVVIALLVHSSFGLVAETTLASGPVEWLLAYSYMTVCGICVASSTSMIFFLGFVQVDREWNKWAEPFRKASAGIDQIELLLYVGPFALSMVDLFLVKESGLLLRFLPEYWGLSAFFVLCANSFFGLCHAHSLLSGGCYLHPWMKDLYEFKAGGRFLVTLVTSLTILCGLFRKLIVLRATLW